MEFRKTGNKDIDDQHQGLVDCLARLEHFSGAGHDTAAAFDAMAMLLTYTQEHFSFEEQFLVEQGYPELAEHIQQHAAIAADLHRLWDDMEAGKDVALRIIEKLKAWIFNHIDQEDGQFADYLGMTQPA